MITNRVGPPVRGTDFYGREPFVDLLWEKLWAGNVLMAAPRRFGKTSVMYRLIDEPRHNCKIVHADLEHLIEPSDLITLLIVELAKDDVFSKFISRLSYFPKTFWARFQTTFEEVELLKLRIKLREKVRDDWQAKGEELFKLIERAPRPILFILDEFPMMIDRMARSKEHRDEAKTMLRWLRRLRQSPSTTNVRFLIAGSIGIGHVLNSLGEISAINDFEQVRLEAFTPKVALGLLEELSSTHRISLSIPSRRKLIKMIGVPIPFFVQAFFSEIAKSYAQTRQPITPKLIERIYHDKVLGVDCKTYFEHYYGRLRDYYGRNEEKAVKRILRELSLVGSLTRDACFQFYRLERGARANAEEFNGLMTNLENDFYISFDHKQQRYEFASKLLRDWWLRHYGLESFSVRGPYGEIIQPRSNA